MVSVIIPARIEPYLQETINSLFNTAESEIEVIAVLDAYWPDPPIQPHPNLILVHKTKNTGMRDNINSAARIARGKYIMKCDAHCVFDQGWDVKLAADCKPNWCVVPRRYDLPRKTWPEGGKRGKRLYEFQYISYPKDPKYPFKGCNWPEYASRVEGQNICDLMTFQGSCWFMHKDFFWNTIGGLDTENYGTMGREAQEVCLKTWLSGGRCVLNRNTWYAHWKRAQSREYKKPIREWEKSAKYNEQLWLNNKWPGQKRELSWLLKRFAPVPGWHTSMEYATATRFIQEKYKLGFAQKYPVTIRRLNRNGLYDLWNKLGYKVGCEVGVKKGGNARNMLKRISELRLYCVDQWENYTGQRKRRNHKTNRAYAIKNLAGLNAVMIAKKSEDAYRDIADESLDFVYIDANHTYDFAMLDIILWARKVRSGGIVAGHDYFTNPKDRMRVKSAVNNYVRAHYICPLYLTDNKRNIKVRGDKYPSWFFVKA